MLTLKYFNSVVEKPSKEKIPYISEDGYVILPEALWAKDKILDFYEKEKLSGNQLNKTFHKSWKKIKESSRCELLIEQILHYMSTYGSNFEDEVYIPEEVLKVPGLKLTYKIIKGTPKEELKEKSLDLLRSGIALKQVTIDEILILLVDELDYEFTGKEGIKNKEAIIRIADLYSIYPDNPTEFLRYIIYRSTESSLLIKSKDAIEQIKKSGYNPAVPMRTFGLHRLAEIFNRFKPLFLAYKKVCPKTINKISRLSRKYHKPLYTNALNEVTQRRLNGEDKKQLEKATTYHMFKALSACYSRMKGQDTFVYRIRNGKSWTKEAKVRQEVCIHNYYFLLEHLKEKYKKDLKGKKVFLPKNVEYALPTTEKMYVGNIPTGSRFRGNKLAVGIYWENKWGARDLDLSGLNIGGKVGWNSTYSQAGDLMFSGDITNAREGAVEYLYANKGLTNPTLVLNNVYTGENTAGYKILVGKGSKIDKEYMMNPNKLLAEVKTNCVQKQMILGILLPEEKDQTFVLLNFGTGNIPVSGRSGNSEIMIRALYQQWTEALTFGEILQEFQVEFVENPLDADYDFSLDSLEKDSFTKLFQR